MKLPTGDSSVHSNVAFQYGPSPDVVDKSCGVGARITFTVTEINERAS